MKAPLYVTVQCHTHVVAVHRFLCDMDGRPVKRFKSPFDPSDFEGDVRSSTNHLPHHTCTIEIFQHSHLCLPYHTLCLPHHNCTTTAHLQYSCSHCWSLTNCIGVVHWLIIDLILQRYLCFCCRACDRVSRPRCIRRCKSTVQNCNLGSMEPFSLD